MRKIILCLTATFFLVFAYGSAYAITGLCYSCHTMHNSQDGNTMSEDGNVHAHLLLGSCTACHTGTYQGYNNTGNYPKVDMPTSSYLAGGSFNNSVANTTTRRHDVTDIFTGGDTGMNGTPGQLSNSLQVGPLELGCAGALGCHGRHDSASNSSDAGIKGFHHGSVGQSGYRFLWIGNSANNGTPVLGKGSADWEEGGATSSNHNVYSADLTAGISRFCAYCHGEFHGAEGEVGTGTALDPFVRHPTDRALGSGGANWSWGNFNWQTTAYNQTPLAFTDFTSVNYTNVNTNTVYFGNTDYSTTGAVMCLSCHRAHGSQYEDILRWEYDMQAGTNSTAGCLACHYLQRGPQAP